MPTQQPNIIVILIDDMGARDLGCTGSSFHDTPHLDQFAAEGVNFTCGYAASPVCSPARAALLTGRAPARVGITNYIAGNAQGRLLGAPFHFHLPHSERTIASALREGGYRTWHVGKWHLGGAAEGSLPTDHGFDVSIGGDHRGGLHNMPRLYFGPFTDAAGRAIPGLEDSREGEYLTDRLTEEAMGLIRSHSGEQPFFLHLSHYVVHTPIASPPDLVRRYEQKARDLHLDTLDPLVPGEPMPALHFPGERVLRRAFQSHTGYAAMIANLDWNVGRLLAALRETGQDENTLVVFLSDNGGLSAGVEGSVTCNLPYREGKGWTEEGGLRVPLLVRWPAAVRPGRSCDTPVWQCDLYPTFLQAAGLPLEPERHLEGVGLLDLLTAGDEPERECFCWHYPHYPNQGALPASAIRQGDYKLIECLETGKLSLYNVVQDVSETLDLAAAEPARAQQMLARLRAWRQEVGAKHPTPNPHYEDIIAGRHARPDGAGNFPAEA